MNLEQIRQFNPWEATGQELFDVIQYCEKYNSAESKDQRDKPMAEAVAEHWDLLQAEAAIQTRIAELDGALQYTADEACQFIEKFGYDYENRKVLNQFIDDTNKTKEQLLTDLFALVHKRRRLCNRFGIEFCR